MGQLRVTAIRHLGRRQPLRRAIPRNRRQEGRQPGRELLRCQHAAHEVRFGQARREEILARGFVRQWAGDVPLVELGRLDAEQLLQRRVVCHHGPVPDEAEGERRLVMFTFADRVAQSG